MAAARWRCTPACFMEQQAADGEQPLIISMFDKTKVYRLFQARITCNIFHLPDNGQRRLIKLCCPHISVLHQSVVLFLNELRHLWSYRTLTISATQGTHFIALLITNYPHQESSRPQLRTNLIKNVFSYTWPSVVFFLSVQRSNNPASICTRIIAESQQTPGLCASTHVC